MTNDLKNFLEGRYANVLKGEVLDTKENDIVLINFVLSLVEKEVEKYSIEMQGGNPFPTEGESTAKDISTIINNLRV